MNTATKWILAITGLGVAAAAGWFIYYLVTRMQKGQPIFPIKPIPSITPITPITPTPPPWIPITPIPPLTPITPLPLKAPPPTNLSIANDQSNTYITWKAPVDSAGNPITLDYQVFVQGRTSPFFVLNGGTQITVPGTYNLVYVLSFDHTGGRYQLVSDAITTNPLPPAPSPTNITIKQVWGGVQLSWQASASVPLSYSTSLSNGTGVVKQQNTTTNTILFPLQLLQQNTSYTFTVTSYDSTNKVYSQSQPTTFSFITDGNAVITQIPNNAFSQTDYNNQIAIQTGLSSVDACAQYCANTNGCAAFSYFRDTTDPNIGDAVCTLLPYVPSTYSTNAKVTIGQFGPKLQ